jgi:phosphate transport system protein
MVREALDAFVRGDETRARDVLARDDQVDGLKRDIFREVIALMKKDSEAVDRGLCLILIARNLERIGDHATNIAEDVIFAETGKDVRHKEGS